MIVYAVNVHTGGGKVLLDELLEGNTFGPISTLFVDTRFNYQRAQELGIEIHKVEPKLRSRFNAETTLKKIASMRPSENVLFFGNLPPLKRIQNKSILYLQNCFLLSPIPLPKDSIKVFFRTILERLWLKFFLKNIDEVWVQTNWMIKLFKSLFPGIEIFLKPFSPILQPIPRQQPQYDFISVTSLSGHKNLDTFLKALKILDKSFKRKISVMLVLDSKFVPAEMARLQFTNITISIKNSVTRHELGQLYACSQASVITSSYESFCLPLYESAFYGTPVIALDTPFARESGAVTTYYALNEPEVLADVLIRAQNTS